MYHIRDCHRETQCISLPLWVLNAGLVDRPPLQHRRMLVQASQIVCIQACLTAEKHRRNGPAPELFLVLKDGFFHALGARIHALEGFTEPESIEYPMVGCLPSIPGPCQSHAAGRKAVGSGTSQHLDDEGLVEGEEKYGTNIVIA